MLPGLGDRLHEELKVKIALENEYGRCSVGPNLVGGGSLLCVCYFDWFQKVSLRSLFHFSLFRSLVVLSIFSVPLLCKFAEVVCIPFLL
jgi:hypothetical protein